jgi:hypothetical protein
MPQPLNWLVYLVVFIIALVILLWFLREVGMTV